MRDSMRTPTPSRSSAVMACRTCRSSQKPGSRLPCSIVLKRSWWNVVSVRNQFIEHLKFAAELGVAGISTDPLWRSRSGETQKTEPSAAEPAPVAAPVAVYADTLAAIRADIGDDCRRCKLHTLGRKQIVLGV